MLVTDRKGRGNLGVNFVSRYKLPRNFEITGTECFELFMHLQITVCVEERPWFAGYMPWTVVLCLEL